MYNVIRTLCLFETVGFRLNTVVGIRNLKIQNTQSTSLLIKTKLLLTLNLTH